MTQSTRRRIERLIRRYRRICFNRDDTYFTDKIIRAKKLLLPLWDKEHDELIRMQIDKALNVYFL